MEPRVLQTSTLQGPWKHSPPNVLAGSQLHPERSALPMLPFQTTLHTAEGHTLLWPTFLKLCSTSIPHRCALLTSAEGQNTSGVI